MSPQSLTAVHFIVCGEGTRDNEWIVAESNPLTYANLPRDGTVKILQVPPSPQKNITPVVRIFPKVAEPNLVPGTDEPLSFGPKLPAPNPLGKGAHGPAPPIKVLGSVASAGRQPTTSLRVRLTPKESARTLSTLFVSRVESKQESLLSTVVAQTPTLEPATCAATSGALAQALQVEPTSGLSSAVPNVNERSAVSQAVQSTCPIAPEQSASPMALNMPVTQGQPQAISFSSAAPASPHQSVFRGSLMIARPAICSLATSPSFIHAPVSEPAVSSSSFGQWVTSGQPVSRMGLPSPTKSKTKQGAVPGANTSEDQEQRAPSVPKNLMSSNNDSLPPFRQTSSAADEVATSSSTALENCPIFSDSAVKESPKAPVPVQRRAADKTVNVIKQASMKGDSEHDAKFSPQERTESVIQDLTCSTAGSNISTLRAATESKGISLPIQAPTSFNGSKAVMDSEVEDRIFPQLKMIRDNHRLSDTAGNVASEVANDALDRSNRLACENGLGSERGIGVGGTWTKSIPSSSTVHNDIQSGRKSKFSCGGLENCVAQLVWVVSMCRGQRGIAKERIAKLKGRLRNVVRRGLHGQLQRIQVSSDAAYVQSNSDVPGKQWTTPTAANLAVETASSGEVAALDMASDFQYRRQLPTDRNQAGSAGGRNCILIGEQRNESMSQGKNVVYVKGEDVRGIYFIFAQWGLSLSRQERPVHRIAAEAERIAKICAGLRSPKVSNASIRDEDVPRYFKQLDAVAHPILFLVGEMRTGLCNCANVPVAAPEVHLNFKQDVKTVLLALRDILEWVRILVDRMLEMYEEHNKKPSSDVAKRFCDDLWSSLFINDNNFIPAMRKTKKVFPNSDDVGDGNVYFSRRKRVGDEVVSLTDSMKEVYIWCQALVEKNTSPKCATHTKGSAVVSLSAPAPKALNQEEEVRFGPGLQRVGEEREPFAPKSAKAAALSKCPDFTEIPVAATKSVTSADANQWPSMSKQMRPCGGLLKPKRRVKNVQKRVLWNLRHDVGASALVQSGDMLQYLFADGENLLGTADKLQREAVADRAAQVSKGTVHALYGWLRIHCVNLQSAVLGKIQNNPEWINLGLTPYELHEVGERRALLCPSDSVHQR